MKGIVLSNDKEFLSHKLLDNSYYYKTFLGVFFSKNVIQKTMRLFDFF